MEKKAITIVADYAEVKPLTLDELATICGLPKEQIEQFIHHEVIVPQKVGQELFDIMQLVRLQKAMRLQRDFEVNLQGIVLVLDLLDQLSDLRSQITILKKHYKNSNEE